MRRIVLVSLVVLTSAPGCKSLPYKGEHDKPQAGPAADWPFRPIGMRVHPFTSFVTSKGATSLDARLELVDDMGDVTKGLGKFRFELYSGGGAEVRGQDQRLYVWEASAATLDETREHYDPITRTYYFKLQLDHPPPRRQKLRLDVQFDGSWGKRLTASAEIETGRE